ncbi:MAG: amidohydrolase [Glaciihabitans sp.]|nr:amidohydrolase [Glaciihabitans sp.]
MPALTLTGVRIIDGSGRAPIADGVLVVDKAGIIVFAGPAAEAPAVNPAEAVDLAGRTLLPGFIDSHVHFGMASANGPFHAVKSDPALIAFEAAERMRITLDAGVTTARDLGGISAGYRAAIDRGLITGPRLKVAVKVISHTGGHADYHLDGGELHTHLEGWGELADSVDEIRRAARRIIRSGADVIKICTTGGMGSPHDSPDDEGLRIDEVRAIVDELERHGGKPLAAHAQGTAGIHAAVLGGVTSIEHGYGIDDEAIDMMGERGTFLVPTLSTVYSGINRATMEPYHYEKKMRWSGITKTNIAHAIERGARFAMGTDSGVGAHGQNLRELGYMVDLGMSPGEAIVAGTATAAQLLGVSDTVGTLTAGKLADFIVSAVDPLTNITGLGDPDNVLVVATGGKIVKDTAGLFSPSRPSTPTRTLTRTGEATR